MKNAFRVNGFTLVLIKKNCSFCIAQYRSCFFCFVFLFSAGKRTLFDGRAGKTSTRTKAYGRHQSRNRPQVSSTNQYCSVGWAGVHGIPVWSVSKIDLVGVLLGYHGTCNLFCGIWNCHGLLRLLCVDKTGKKWSPSQLYTWKSLEHVFFLFFFQEFLYPDARDRQFLLFFHKLSKRKVFDIRRYNEIKDAILKIEADLQVLRSPLFLHLPENARMELLEKISQKEDEK